MGKEAYRGGFHKKAPRIFLGSKGNLPPAKAEPTAHFRGEGAAGQLPLFWRGVGCGRKNSRAPRSSEGGMVARGEIPLQPRVTAACSLPWRVVVEQISTCSPCQSRLLCPMEAVTPRDTSEGCLHWHSLSLAGLHPVEGLTLEQCGKRCCP